MRAYLLLTAAALSLSACAPRALYFHESTKVAFAADYNTSDSQPLATSFGYKRRIVAVVPSQQRDIPQGGSERTGTNSGEALSLVSKFNVRAGTGEGVAITNNFASGMAARIMTRSVGSPEALNVLMHSAPIPVSAETGRTLEEGKPATEAVNARLAAIRAKRTRPSGIPGSGGNTIDLDSSGNLNRTNKSNKEVPKSSGTVDLDQDGNLKTDSNATQGTSKPGVDPKKEVPKSEGTVDLTPTGEIKTKKK